MDMDIREYLRPFTVKDNRMAAVSYFGTLSAFLAAIWASVELVDAGYWWASAPLIVVITFSLARAYVLQHDTGHYSLFRERWQNDLAGHFLSVFTFTPYRAMQYNHNMHHAYLGNLERRETTEIHTMTVREWRDASPGQRLRYRLYRNPLILLPAGGLFTYFIAYRWPKNATKVGVPGIIAHNLMMLAWFFILHQMAGWAGLAVLATSAVIASMLGVFMVYLQHNFEDTYWDRKPGLDFRSATLQGSSCLDLGHLWDIGTCNIAYHDIHHFMPAIPSYKLRKAHHGMPEDLARQQRRIKWPEALRSFRLKLWDEESRRLVPFPREAGHAPVPAE